MGTLNLPATGLVYVDTAPVIYSVEKNPDFHPLMLPLWQAMKTGRIEVCSSSLTLLETLVVPNPFMGFRELTLQLHLIDFVKTWNPQILGRNVPLMQRSCVKIRLCISRESKRRASAIFTEPSNSHPGSI